MVIYYHYVLFYIADKGGNVLVGVVPNFNSFRDIFLNIFAVLIEDMIVPYLFLHYLGQCIQEFTKSQGRSIDRVQPKMSPTISLSGMYRELSIYRRNGTNSQ